MILTRRSFLARVSGAGAGKNFLTVAREGGERLRPPLVPGGTGPHAFLQAPFKTAAFSRASFRLNRG
jgi:hypothetical protein